MGRESLKKFRQFISSLVQNHLKQNIEKWVDPILCSGVALRYVYNPRRSTLHWPRSPPCGSTKIKIKLYLAAPVNRYGRRSLLSYVGVQFNRTKSV